MQWHEFLPNVRHLSTKEQARIREAFELGKNVHGNQARKSGEPYFTHPIAVAHALADMGADSDTIIAALLHDTVEDTPLTLEEIGKQFGKDVYALIEGVTKLSRADIGEAPNLDEQIETLRKIFTLMEKDIRIMVIKLVDRLHNMQTVEFLSATKQQDLARETMDVYVKIADRLCMQDLRDELEALCLTVLEPDVLLKLTQLRSQNETKGQDILADLLARLSSHFPQHADDVHMQYEHKSWDNLREQLQTEGTAVTGVSGISIAFVCDTADTCYSVLGSLHRMWPREMMSFQDFINSPAINGYRGLHTTIIFEDGTRIRCKIRTQEMQEYARKGVASVCFNSKTRGLFSTLPWTERISPLATDTEGRSKDFRDSLQSDILGESIVIHGPGDQAVLVPKGSTALDGAFYLLGKEALRAQSIRISGKEAQMDTPLSHAMSLNVILDEKVLADRSWLEKVHTGFAMATIRSAIAEKMTTREKISLGTDLLQKVMTEHKKGFLEEFDPKNLSNVLYKFGYSSLQAALIAIAENRADPLHIYRLLFEPVENDKKNENGRKRVDLSFVVEANNRDFLRRLLSANEQQDYHMHRVTFRKIPFSNKTKIRISADLTRKEQGRLVSDITAAGAGNIEFAIRTKRELALLISVIVLWSLNPVAARWFLDHGMTAPGLFTLRFLTFGVYAAAFFSIWWIYTKQALSPIPRISRIAWLPTLGNAGMSLYYFALVSVPPSLHITLLRFNAMLLWCLSPGKTNRARSMSIIIFLMLLSASLAAFLFFMGQIISAGLVFSVTTMLSYTFYSLWTERVLQHHRIGIRYPYLLLHIGILSTVLGLIMLPWQNHSALWNNLTPLAILYIIFCVCLSHTFYTALLKTTRFKHITDLLLVEVPITIALEITLLGIRLPLPLYACIAVILLGLLSFRRIDAPDQSMANSES